MFPWVKTYEIVWFQYVQLVVCQLHLSKATSKKETSKIIEKMNETKTWLFEKKKKMTHL